MSTGPVVKTQLEMQEEMNRRMIEAEEKKWIRDQIHMEAQIRNTIEQTHAVKKTVERDQERMRKKEEEKIKKEKEMAKKNKEREEHMKSVLETANKAKKDWINREVRKFKKIQKDFHQDLKESMEIWDTYKNDSEALAKHSLARLRRLNEKYDPEHMRASVMNRSSHSAAAKSDKGKESSMSPDGEGGHNSSAKSGRASTPEYIRQRRKYEQHMHAKYHSSSEHAQELEAKIKSLEQKNKERDMLIAEHKQKVNEKMRDALSEIEKNQQEAAKKLKKKMEETVHVYVEKQIKGEQIRKKHSEEEHKKLVAARKQFEERLKDAALKKIDEDKLKVKKLKLEQNKKQEILKKMAIKSQHIARERYAKSIEKDEKIQTVLHNHHEIMEEHVDSNL